MLFSLKRPLFTVSPFLNEYLKNSEYKYMKNINNIIENRNKKKLLFGENENNESNKLIIVPIIFFLSLTTIINYFYSKKT